MVSFSARKILKYSAVAGFLGGTAVSLKGNQYNIDNIGIVRLARAGAAVFKIGLLYNRSLYSSDLDPESVEYARLKSKVDKEAAEELLKLCRANKGVFVKVGQHVGSLQYLLPQEYVDTMQVLHSHAPTSPVQHVKQVILQELKQPVEELFCEFNEEPLGAASLAQVHRARLTDGRQVAVKVQHPYVRGNSFIDVATMELLVEIVSRVFPEFKFKWLVEESKKNIARELNFKEEVENTVIAREMFSYLPWLKIPEVYPELSTSRVVVMEYVEGGQVNDKKYMSKNGIDRFEVSDKLGRLYSEMIFSRGFVHSDPHPGNILVRRQDSGRAQIVLLDHGLYAKVSEGVKNEYSKLWLSILRKDTNGMKVHCSKLGVDALYPLFACMVSGRTWDSITSGIATTKHTPKEKEVFQKDVPMYLPEITEVLSTVNRELLLILKTNDLLRGIEHTLETHNRMSSLLVISRFCVRCVYTEKLAHSEGWLAHGWTKLREQWALLKLNLYYLYLGLVTRSLSSFVNTLTLEFF